MPSDSETTKPRGRFQFVWWWHLWSFGFVRSEGGMAYIYDWSVFVGPLEVRQWTHLMRGRGASNA